MERFVLDRGRPLSRLFILLVGLVVLAASTLAAGPVARAAGAVAIPLNTANWSGSAGFGATAPAWYLDSYGYVHLQGAAKQVSTGGDPTLIGTLPAAAIPNRNVFTIVHTYGGTYADLGIQTNGQIRVIAPRPPAVTDLSFVSLESVSYLPGTGTALTLNTANWSASAGFGSTAPAWSKDSDGYVHLQGAAKQVVPSGGDPTLIATLPAALTSCFDHFTIVHTYGGTYADLGIQTNGQIRVIAPRPPAVTDLSFVSLESISFFPCSGAPQLALNTANWSNNAGYSSAPAAWFLDINSGVVHFQGAAKLIAGGGGSSLVGTLPSLAWPARTIYTIAHTFDGTYADLSIAPNGEIRVIGPRPPMVADYSFLSLESITYLR
jgi:hypothetical protein